MSALPKAVQKHVDEANRIAANLKQGKPANVNPKSGAVTFESTPPDDAGTPPGSPPPAPAAAAPVPGNSSVVPAGAPVPEEAWEKRYKVLQGKYNAEIPRLQGDLRSRDSRIASLESEVTTLKGLMSSIAQRGASVAPVSAAPSAPAPAAGRLVKDEEVKSFGADLIDVMRRVAREEVNPHLSQLAPVAQRVTQIEKQVKDVDSKVVLNDQEKFQTYLNTHVSNLNEMNTDEGFLTWLDQVDPYTGMKRQDLLDQAANALDGPRVVAFFTGYQNEHAVVAPPANSAPPPASAAPAAAPAPAAATPNPLDRFVAPGAARAGAAGTPNDAQKRVFTRAEIQDFEMRRNSFVRRNKKVPDNLVQLEREIFAAASEGRIQQ